jgi:hypothetical protein
MSSMMPEVWVYVDGGAGGVPAADAVGTAHVS